MRRLERADPPYIGSRVWRQVFGEVAQRLQPAQPFSREIAVHDLVQLVWQKQTSAQQIGPRPIARVFKESQRLRHLLRKARGERPDQVAGAATEPRNGGNRTEGPPPTW